MAEYNFDREIVDGKYNVNNQYAPETLAAAIKGEETLPDAFQIKCDAAEGCVTFDPALTAGQETTLYVVIAAHKAHAAP